MDRLSFVMTLDILEGCKYSCMDCSVDKTLSIRDIPNDDVIQLISLATEMRLDYNAWMYEFVIGPTDFITSKNGMGIFEHPLIQGLIPQFESIVIALSLLSQDGLVELAEKLNRYANGKLLRLAVPLPIKSAYNPKFVTMLRKHIKILSDAMSECEFYRIYSTVIMTGDSLERLSMESLEYMNHLDLGIWQIPEWSFGHSRSRFDDILTHQRFINDYREWVRKMGSFRESTFCPEVVPDPNDGLEVTYRNGKLYYLPYIGERFHWWHDYLEIPKPWTAANVIKFKDNLIKENMLDVKHSSDCNGCPHEFNCNSGDVKTVMRMMGVTKCLPDIAHRHDLVMKIKPKGINGIEMECYQ